VALNLAEGANVAHGMMSAMAAVLQVARLRNSQPFLPSAVALNPIYEWSIGVLSLTPMSSKEEGLDF
jgi:ribose/xylose/arabinose/galactoside ABC-type transport system permease subunit